MNPARWPRRMPPRPPFEGRYPASTHQPPEAATRNNPPVNRGPQPSRGNLLLAPRHSPLNHTYLLPVQSHPHSTVLPLLAAKLRHNSQARQHQQTKVARQHRGSFWLPTDPNSHPYARPIPTAPSNSTAKFAPNFP